jgi:hypothetical protein
MLLEGDIGPDAQLGGMVYAVGDMFSFKCLAQDGPPHSLGRNKKVGEWQGKQRGLMDIAAVLGWWKDGMTGDGRKIKDKWVKGDIVIVKFDKDTALPPRGEDWFEIFRVKSAEKDHKKLKDGCWITVNPLVAVAGNTNRHKINTKTTYKFMSTQLTGVAPDELKLISGNPSKQNNLVVELDIDSYMQNQVEDGADEGVMEEVKVDGCSLKSVMGAPPMFKNERSRVVQLIEERTDRHGALVGHDVGFSAKNAIVSVLGTGLSMEMV